MRPVAYPTCLLLLFVHFIPSESRSYHLSDDQYTFEHNHIDKYEPSEDLNVDGNVEDRHTHDHSTYSYEYNIHSPQTGDYKSQREERIGDSVRGSYSLIEPDGRKRIVEYTADPQHGFQATVKHEPPSPDLHKSMELTSHRFEVPPASARENVTPTTRFQHLSLLPSPLRSTATNKPKSKPLFYTIPSSFYLSTTQPKSTSATSTASPARYYFNPLARLGWPFIR